MMKISLIPFFGHLSDFNCEDITIGSDFNLVLDTGKDKKGRPCQNA